MNTIKMKLSELKHPEKNPRKHPAKQIKEMKRSLETFGQFRPIVIDENNVILAGNGLVIAMKEKGYEEADVLQYKNLTENQKKKLMLSDNQIASLGVDDYDAIEAIIKEIGIEYDIPGYDDTQLELIVAESSAAVESAMSYGVYPQEEVNRLREVEAKREETSFDSVAPTYNTPPQPVNIPTPIQQYEPPQNVSAEEHEEYKVQETKRFVICPHCGEKIYI